MKRNRILRFLTDYIIENRRIFLISLLCLVAGVVIGSLSAFFLNKNDFDVLGLYLNNFASAHSIQSVNRSSVFTFSIYNNIKIILFMFVSGLRTELIPIGFLQLCTKGYKIGFTSVILVQLYFVKGVFIAFASVLPQFILTIPALLFYNVFNVNFALFSRKLRQHGQKVSERRDLLICNTVCLLSVFVIFALVSLIDTFVIPTVIKPICSYLT